MTEVQDTQAERAPWHLWVVGIIATLWNAMGGFDYIMTQTRNAEYMGQFTPDKLEYFYSLPTWVVSAWAIAVWGGVLGSILLLLRKKLAVWVLLVSLGAMVLTTIHNYFISDGLKVMGGAGELMFAAAIFAISLVLFFYARLMVARGVLR